MGLTGGIVQRVFSKSPCSSAGGSRGHSEKGSAADHRRRWSSLRLYLCGEEMNAAAEEEEDDDGETVSVKSFETCCVMPPDEAHVVPVVDHRLMSHADNTVDDNPGEPAEDRSRVPGGEQSHGNVVVPARKEEGAATLIQSAFRGFLARRQLQELRTRQEQEETDGAQQEPTRSPTWASVATSVLVQVGEPLSNLRLSEESASVQQQRSSQRSRPPPPPPAFRVKEEWDDSTVSSNVSRMRIQSRIEATTRRERALAYAFSQQLRSCGGGSSKKRTARAEQGEFNVGWSWLERWMATRQAEPAADDCMSRNADTASATAAGHRRVVVVRRRNNDLAVEEKESCGSNDVSVVSFDGSSSLGGAGGARSGLSCHKPPGGKSRLKGGRNLPRRKQAAASDHHRFQARSHKVSKKGHHRVEQAPHKDRLDAGGFDFDACQPPTDY
ncbi:protein IQ-DOMAIN 33-like [Miscanthus floridulus]|uniref:protein IQ-DOMAIN 33-like n=1 Tax=Miscanthus floridulus TaxID=154761 RepID=UPI00345ADB9B